MNLCGGWCHVVHRCGHREWEENESKNEKQHHMLLSFFFISNFYFFCVDGAGIGDGMRCFYVVSVSVNNPCFGFAFCFSTLQ